VKKANLKLPPKDKLLDKLYYGTLEHWIDERWTLQFLREWWDCPTYYEVVSKLNGIVYNRKHPDLAAVIGDNDPNKDYSLKHLSFRNWLLFNQKVIPFTKEMRENIHQMNVDFIHGKKIRDLVDKAKRYYQGKHKMLVIVLTGTEQSGKVLREELLRQNDVKNLPYKENIFVLNSKEFAQFIGLHENAKSPRGECYYDKYMEGSKLYEDAYRGKDPGGKELERVSAENQDFLTNEFLKYFGEGNGKTDGWVEYLKMMELEHIIMDNPLPKNVAKVLEKINFAVLQGANFIGGTATI